MTKSRLQAAQKASSANVLSISPGPKDPNDRDLEKQDFYHGFRPRKDVEHILKEPGDFLVRVTDTKSTGGEPLLVVSALSEDKKMLNLTIQFIENRWQFSLNVEAQRNPRKSKDEEKTAGKKKKLPGFKTVVELVQHYRTHKMPGRAYLRHAIPRPTWLISHDKVEYKNTDLLGSGNFCHVYRGIFHRTDKDKFDVAVKVCHEGKVASEANEESTEARKGMISEAQLMTHYTHEYIIQMFGVAMGHPPILILMEYCAGGNLESHLKKTGDRLDLGEAIVYALEAARGMRYLHTVNCVHRDLAARNVLISSKGTMKIADFGLSKLVADLEKKSAEDDKEEPSPQIPLRWMAPESLKKPMQFSPKSDVWSFGVLLYEIFNQGVKPWPEDPPKKIATMIRKAKMPSLPPKTPSAVTELAGKIWVIEAESRPSMTKVVVALAKGLKAVPPPTDLNLWDVNTIPGVKRSSLGDMVTEITGTSTTTEEEAKAKPSATASASTAQTVAATDPPSSMPQEELPEDSLETLKALAKMAKKEE